MKLPSMISFKGDRNDAMFPPQKNTCYSLNYAHTSATYQETFHFSYFLLSNLTYRSHKKARLNFTFTDIFLPVQNIIFCFCFFFNTIRGDNGYIIYILLVPLKYLFLMPNIRSTEFKSIAHSILDFYLIYYTGIK